MSHDPSDPQVQRTTRDAIRETFAKMMYENMYAVVVTRAGGQPKTWEGLTEAERAGWRAVESSTYGKASIDELHDEWREEGRLRD